MSQWATIEIIDTVSNTVHADCLVCQNVLYACYRTRTGYKGWCYVHCRSNKAIPEQCNVHLVHQYRREPVTRLK